MSDHTARDVAEIFGCDRQKVIKEAHRVGVGYNLRGTAGWRFTEADIEKLRKAMAPAPVPVRRRSA